MSEETEYKNINVSINNIEELKMIRRELESFHNEDFRIDVAIGHVLRVYKMTMKVLEKKEDQTMYLKYLQKL